MKNRFRFSDILLMMLVTPQPMEGQPEIVQLMYLSLLQGLSNKFISCLLQNWEGFVRFGFCLGSTKYEGYSFTPHQPTPADPTLLCQPFLPGVDWYNSIPNGKWFYGS